MQSGKALGVLAGADLVIGVDTGPLHWAAAVGTRVLGLYFGEAGFHDTGPYGDGHLVLAPDCSEYPCHPQRACQCGWRCRQTFQDARSMSALLLAVLNGTQATVALPPQGLRPHHSQLTPQGNIFRAAGGEDMRMNSICVPILPVKRWVIQTAMMMPFIISN